MATGTISRRFVVKSYSVTPEQNSHVSPFSYYVVYDISSDISTYGELLFVRVYGSSSANPITWKFNGNMRTIWFYSALSATITFQVFY